MKDAVIDKNNEVNKEVIGYVIAAILIAFLVLANVSEGAGLLKPTNGDASDVFIKSHHVNVVINNGFAKTEVDQVFGNSSDIDLEAIYTFPVPKQASLSEVSLWIDGKEIIGEVVERQQARQIYEDQLSKGNDTALAEKNDYMTFDVSVYPVRAGSETRVRLVYYQPLEIDSNVGRYLYPLAEGGVDDQRISFWAVDDVVHEEFTFDLTLKSAFPVQDVRVPGYMDKALIEQTGQAAEEGSGQSDEYHIRLDSTEGDALTRDIIVYYRLADDVPARVEVVPYRAGKNEDGTFMVVVTPAADLQRITEGIDWVFVLDKSGSMSGGKIATLADGVSRVIAKMSANDRFRVITFNNGAQDFSGGFKNATEGNVQSILGKLSALHADGGTNLFAGLSMAYNGLDDDRTTNILLVTDGVANIGPTQHSDFLNLLCQYDIRLYTFVIGNSANQPLMERLAKDSNGFAMNISDSDDIVGRIMQVKSKILYEGLHDVELKFHGERVKDLTPAKPGSLYQGQQLVMFGRYTGSGPVRVELSAKISGQQHSWDCDADFPEIDTDNPEIERLWALSMIDEMMQEIREMGESASLKQAIVNLGTEYSLVTDYTSMVVLSEEQMEEAGIQRRNADRVNRERTAQQQRNNQPAKNYRVDQNKQNPSGNNGAFDGRKSPGIGTGSGPVGPLFVGLAMWLNRRKRKQ